MRGAEQKDILGEEDSYDDNSMVVWTSRHPRFADLVDPYCVIFGPQLDSLCNARGPLLPIIRVMRGTGFPTWLGKADPDGLIICLGSEASDIVTCRVTRSPQDLPLRMIDLLFSCERGSSDLEVCYTSKTLEPPLCQPCTEFMTECGTRKEIRTRWSLQEQPVT